jgi:hypothetical protein
MKLARGPSGERLLEADMICTRMALPMAAPGEKQTARQLPPHSQLIHASSPSTILILGTRDRPSPICASPLLLVTTVTPAALARCQSEDPIPDDAACAVDTTKQRRIIPCSQISEPRLRFRPRGRRYAASRCRRQRLVRRNKRKHAGTTLADTGDIAACQFVQTAT